MQNGESEPIVGPARAGDLPVVLALLERCGLPDAGLADHVSTLLVARSGGDVVGCAALELHEPDALLRSVAVAPELRGRGLGERLTAAVLDLARARLARRVYLLTETAAGFFPRFGFRTIDRATICGPVTRSVEFATACPASAVAMELVLDPTLLRGGRC